MIDSKHRSSVMNTISEAMNMFAWVIDSFADSVDYKSATSKWPILLAVVSQSHRNRRSHLTAVQAGSSLSCNLASIDSDRSSNINSARNTVSYCTADYCIGQRSGHNVGYNLDCNDRCSDTPNSDYIADCNLIDCNLGCRYPVGCITTTVAYLLCFL